MIVGGFGHKGVSLFNGVGYAHVMLVFHRLMGPKSKRAVPLECISTAVVTNYVPYNIRP
jgi:hypothetical protein